MHGDGLRRLHDLYDDQAVTPGEILLEAQRVAAEARREIVVSDRIIAERDRLLALFECPTHGAGCVPFAVEEVARLRHDVAKLRTIILMHDCLAESEKPPS